MSTSYSLQIQTDAKNDYDQLPTEVQDRLYNVLEEIAGRRRPCTHSKCSLLEGESDVYKVKVGDYRCLLRLRKPELRVLRVGHRQNFYRGIEQPSRDL